jgi:membrane protease YdiL (CAAX protease family)
MCFRTGIAPRWKNSPWPYFVLALGWSWLFWIPVAVTGLDVSESPGIILLAIGILGPAASAIILTYLLGDKQERRDYWERLIGFERIGLRWYAIALLIPPFYSALAILQGLLIDGSMPPLDTAVGYMTNPWRIIPFAILILSYGPLPEEMGWRGYALDRLQRRWNALASSLVLGVIWSIWHMPLFFMRGTLMSDVFPLWSSRFWIAMGPGILSGAVLMTWVYNNTGRSTLAAVLLHFMMNFTGEFLRLPGGLKNDQFLWQILIAVAVIMIYGPATLTGRDRKRAIDRGQESA